MKYTKEHEWVRVEGNLAVVGISEYAQHALGDIVSLDLPQVGTKFKKGQSFAMVDSMKASSDVYAPISGEVAEVNSELSNNPQWVNESPQSKAWFIKLKPENLDELNSLMDEEAYKKYVSESSH
jgi:glycine cleavage system H protein